jgi:hypothetical protein
MMMGLGSFLVGLLRAGDDKILLRSGAWKCYYLKSVGP